MKLFRVAAVVCVVAGLALAGARVFAASQAPRHGSAGISQRIEAVARRIARGMGDRSPGQIVWVATRRQAANRIAGGDIVDSNQPVYLVAVRGRFVDRMASVPPGASAPRGTVLTLVLNRGHLQVLDLGVGNQWPHMR
jgi:hypothetical protein